MAKSDLFCSIKTSDASLVQLKKNPSYNASSMTPVRDNNFIWYEYLVEVENVSTEKCS